jgi:hypothetical protein
MDLPGGHSQGDSREEAVRMLKNSIGPVYSVGLSRFNGQVAKPPA